jgi:hypothetical protein
MKNILFDGMKKTCHQKKKENSPVENVSQKLSFSHEITVML